MTAAVTGLRQRTIHFHDNFKDRRDDDRVVETSIPFRLDALHWSGFHTRVVMALGITWILDGAGGHTGWRAIGRAERKSDIAIYEF